MRTTPKPAACRPVPRRRRLLTGTAAAAVASVCSRWGEAHAATDAPALSVLREARAREWFTDTPLVDQDGRTHAFYSDLIAPRGVLINAAFAGCTSACPLLTQQLVRVRDLLGARFERDFWFLSITVDPLGDGPQQLKSFAARQGADGPGWRFLTGEPASVQRVLRKLGLWPDTPDAHQTTLIAGNARSGRWGKLRPDGTPQALALQIERFIAAP